MISEEEVRRIAALAKLELEPVELERMQRDLGSILEFVDQIGEIDVAGTAGERDNGTRSAPLRPDDPRPSLDHDDVAANAPRFVHGHFVVPRILGGE